MRTHLDLDVWKKSIQFVKKIYEITSKFPDTEKYGLTNQMRKCADAPSQSRATLLKVLEETPKRSSNNSYIFLLDPYQS